MLLVLNLNRIERGKGPLIVLLHGFPEFWYSWRKQIPALVDAGFRVVAPDLRGYNDSPKPRDIDAYRISAVIEDVVELIDGRYDVATGRRLLSAVAETTQLAGWATYDAGMHGLAQRYLIQALRLAAGAVAVRRNPSNAGFGGAIGGSAAAAGCR